MASGTRTSESGDFYCNKCKSKVVASVKCVTCGSCYHPSCAKHSKFQIVDKQLVKCCVKIADGVADDASDTGFFDAMDNIASEMENKIDIQIFKYIIKQKDMLIFELRDKIKSLNTQLESLSITNKEQKPQSVKTGDVSKTKRQIKTDNHMRDSRPSTSEIVRAVTTKNVISVQDVSEAIDEANKLTNISPAINTKYSDAADEVTNNNLNWQQVLPKRLNKRNRKLIVGTFSGPAAVEGIERSVALHVSNLKPNTSTDDLCKFLRQNFPEVTCTALTSRYPDLYSSFKVNISKSNYDKAMNASMWPSKSCVRHFFQRKNVSHVNS